MRLEILRDGSAVGVAAIANGSRTVVLGSGGTSNLELEDDDEVAAEHVRLDRRADLWWMSALGGDVQLRGRPVTTGMLSHGDQLRIGAHTLKVLLDETEQGARAAVDTDPSADPDRLAHIVVKRGGRGVYRLYDTVFRVGKGPENDLQVAGWKVPTQLAAIVRGLSSYHVLALSGADVRVNSKPIELRCALRDGDQLSFKDVFASFHKGPPR